MSKPLPDLESQLAAELDGASWAVAAFVAEDAQWADWLYRNLNGFPVLASLIGEPTAYGLARPDCVSIFPDRRDPDYAAHYPQALEKSGYLIVVCSPRSARCPAVDAQICAFKKAGGEERIIALVVEGAPDRALESAAKSAEPAWLPAWLRWRLTDDAFSETDRGEPQVVDARPGRTSLKEVRDQLLAKLLEVDAWELEITGCLARPTEDSHVAPEPEFVADAPALPAPVCDVAVPRWKIGPLILTAAICVSATLAAAWWSFGRTAGDGAPQAAAPAQTVRVLLPPTASQPSVVLTAPAPEPAPPAISDAQPAPPPVPVASLPLVKQASVPPAAPIEPLLPTSPTEESLAHMAIIGLHHRGDAAVAQHRFEDALGYYSEAVDTIRATAARAPAGAKADGAVLCRKLGTLQLQMASTAEARASFVQGRKLLLQLKAAGHWNGERAKVLAEIDTGLRRLPRD